MKMIIFDRKLDWKIKIHGKKGLYWSKKTVFIDLAQNSDESRDKFRKI